MVVIELAVVLVLILINGFLAMSELAVVSSRKPRLQALANKGSQAAIAALALVGDPGRFLSTVQIGITLVGVLAGAFSGATLAERHADYLESHRLSGGVAETISFAVLAASITYLSLIIGELIPKHLALRNPEKLAAFVAKPLTLMAQVADSVKGTVSRQRSAEREGVCSVDRGVGSLMLLNRLGRNERRVVSPTTDDCQRPVLSPLRTGHD